MSKDEKAIRRRTASAQDTSRALRCLVSRLPVFALVYLLPLDLVAKPRPPLPALPEWELGSWRFNGFDQRRAMFSLNYQTVESWSGLALQMTGEKQALLAFPELTPEGKTNLFGAVGTLRFWYAPAWTSVVQGGQGPGIEARLFEVGAWSETEARASWSLVITADGDRIALLRVDGGRATEVLGAGILWCAGEWHQVALTWSPKGTGFYLDGELAAEGLPAELAPPTDLKGFSGFCLGSDAAGDRLAQGQLEDVFSFARECQAAEVARNYQQNIKLALLGPITPEEELHQAEAVEAARLARARTPRLLTLSTNCQSGGWGVGPYASRLGMPVFTNTGGDSIIKLAITGGADGLLYDLYMTTNLTTVCDGNAAWTWQGQGTNGQTLMVTNPPGDQVFFMLGCELATNVLVNDPAQDEGNLQNTQSETTLLAFSNTVIVAWVDSNLGVVGYGANDPNCPEWMPPSNTPPQFIGWAVSRDGGATFTDKTNPPLFTYVADGVTKELGNAGDPVLARDANSDIIYLVGNPQRETNGLHAYYPNGRTNDGRLYVPLWRSTDNGETFEPPINATPGPPADGSNLADKPALIVDNFAGPGQGDVYLAFNTTTSCCIYRSAAGGTNWGGCTNFDWAHWPSFTITTNHDIYVVWWNFHLGPQRGTNFFLFSKSAVGGTNFSTPSVILSLNATNDTLDLKRGIGAPAADKFRSRAFPCLAASPVMVDHLYLVYTDAASNQLDKANIYFRQSTNGGATWKDALQVNSDTTTNDQWQPSMAIKPDGTQLFIAWYDRRNDPESNSLIQVYGAFVSLPVTNTGALASNFLISTAQFPPVFAGTTMTGTNEFDTAYPPNPRYDVTNCPTFDGKLAGHMGDYDTAVADDRYVYYAWGDNRRTCSFANGPNVVVRPQADIRYVKIPWPNNSGVQP